MHHPLTRAAAGLVGGVAGTFLMQALLKRSSRLPPSLQPPPAKADPGEFMVGKVEAVARPLPPKLHRAAAKSLQWGYGTVGPVALGLLLARLGLRSTGRVLAAGAALGAIVWGVGYLGWLPAAGLVEPIHRQPIGRTASSLTSHVAYGAVSALPLALLERI